MLSHTKLMPVTAIAVVALGLAVAGAGAHSFEMTTYFSGFRMVWRSLEISSGPFMVRCPMTIEGTFHSRTFPKTSGLLIGKVTRATLNSAACTGGTASVLAGALPWHVQYASFSGTLPNITFLRLRFVGMALSVTVSGRTCLGQTSESSPVVGEVQLSGDRLDVFRFLIEPGIPVSGEGIGCLFLGSAHLTGAAPVTLLGNDISRPELRLI